MKVLFKRFYFVAFVSVMVILTMGCETGTTDTNGSTENSGLPAPQNLTVVSTTSSQISLSWTPVNGAVYYDVYRSMDSTWKNYIILNSSLTNTVYSNTDLSPNTTYYYKVGAKERYTNDPVGELSESASATTSAGTGSSGTFPAPTNLNASVIDSSSGPHVTLTWTPVSGASYYALYQSTDSAWSEYILLTTSVSTTMYTYPYYTNDLPLIT
jgi:hypothetical protein